MGEEEDEEGVGGPNFAEGKVENVFYLYIISL